ncbi:hypothetical protein N1037_17815 [Phaeobacter sp. G2]|jgi:hypothetical protein|nr:hypothetical protein N1037_17815 [Phaeobacter sp. G2]
MNAQKFSMAVGLLVVVGHVAITYLLIFYFDLPEGAKLSEISLPLTVAYVSSVVMWFFRMRGLVTSEDAVGLPLVALVFIIVFAMLGGLFAVPYSVLNNPDASLDSLNDRYLMIEMAFGGVFGIVMSELFGYEHGA